MIKLRDWQSAALVKALDWFDAAEGDNHFLINAAPGAGKTLASCAMAQELINRGEIERVIVIAPRKEVINQWAGDFKQVTGRIMLKVTGADEDAGELPRQGSAGLRRLPALPAPALRALRPAVLRVRHAGKIFD